MTAIEKDFITKCKLTQQEVILLHLIKNGYITNKECNELYGFRHLPSIIRDLKEQWGVQFNTILQKQLNRFQQKTNYVEYHLLNREVYKQCL